jgi:hypothetical protein
MSMRRDHDIYNQSPSAFLHLIYIYHEQGTSTRGAPAPTHRERRRRVGE